jgi:hypothetical protein
MSKKAVGGPRAPIFYPDSSISSIIYERIISMYTKVWNDIDPFNLPWRITALGNLRDGFVSKSIFFARQTGSRFYNRTYISPFRIIRCLKEMCFLSLFLNRYIIDHVCMLHTHFHVMARVCPNLEIWVVITSDQMLPLSYPIPNFLDIFGCAFEYRNMRPLIQSRVKKSW